MVKLFENCVCRFPNAPALTCGEVRLSYGELDTRINRLAHALLDLGVRREGRVGLALYNGKHFLEGMYAAWKIAAIPANISYRYTEKEILHVVRKGDIDTVILDEELVDRFRALRGEADFRNLIVVGGKEAEGFLAYESLIEGRPSTKPRSIWKELGSEDVGWMLFTGGTTGYPKAVLTSQKDLLGLGVDIVSLLHPLLGKISDLPPEVRERVRESLRLRADNAALRLAGKCASAAFALLRREAAGRFLTRAVKTAPFPVCVFVMRQLPRALSGRLRVLVACPMIHGVGWCAACLFSTIGAHIALLPGKHYQAVEAVRVMRGEKVGIINLVGDAFLKPLLDELEDEAVDLESLFLVINAGAPISAATKRRFSALLPSAFLLDEYSSSETMSIGIQLYAPGETVEATGARFAKSPYLKVVNREGGEVKPGEGGEVITTSKYKGSYYYREDEASSRVFRVINGRRWVFTGDLATVDEEGNVLLMGRGSQCINSGGEKVFAEEVEETIREIPQVENVVVVGVPDERWGNAVTAVLRPKEGEGITEEEVRGHCRGRIADYKIPKHVIISDEMPLTAAGKLSYREAREIALRELGMPRAKGGGAQPA